MTLDKEVGDIVFTEIQIQERVQQLADEISADYKDKNILLVTVLKGGVIFLSDLIRRLTVPAAIDFMAISSYGGDSNTGVVKLLKDLDINVEGVHILFVEDIVDTGLTLNYLINNLKSREPASIEVCTLLDRPRRRIVDIEIKYVGFQLSDIFIVGYGLDYLNKYRQLPFIAALNIEP